MTDRRLKVKITVEPVFTPPLQRFIHHCHLNCRLDKKKGLDVEGFLNNIVNFNVLKTNTIHLASKWMFLVQLLRDTTLV